MKIIVDKVRWNQNKFLTLHRKTAEVCNYGVMLEWLKRHAWKACIPQKGIPSSNLGHSADKVLKTNSLHIDFQDFFVFIGYIQAFLYTINWGILRYYE